MNASVDRNPNTVTNWSKLILALLIVVAAVASYYYFTEISWAWRTAGLIVAAGLGLWIAAFTEQGRQARHFLYESNFELRKMVWPTRQETLQTTLVIIVVVIVLSLVIWLIDMFLGWVVLENLLKSR